LCTTHCSFGGIKHQEKTNKQRNLNENNSIMISKLSSLKNKNAFTLFDADNKLFYDTAPTRAQNKYQYVAEEQ
jgi:hypothetical protein